MSTDIETLASWSKPRPVLTKNGERMLRTAPAGDKFWTAWRANKDALKARGVSCSRDDRTGDWEATWWLPVTDEIKTARAERVAESRVASADVNLPAPAGLDYLPYQKAGIAAMLARPNTLLGDEMGLGKTIQAIGLINADDSIKRVLVVCPASLKINWQRECEKWLTRQMSVAIANGAFPTADIVIINYDILSKHRDSINATAWDLCITDEAHYVKNPKAMRSKAERAIKARRRVRMTGTPISNRPAELYNIISDLDPSFGSFMSFAKRYCDAQRGRFGWDFSGASNLDELQRRLRETIMVRRLKADVLAELPAKTRKVVELPITPATAIIVRRMNELAAVIATSVDDMADQMTEADYEAHVEALRDERAAAFEELSRLRHELAIAKAPQVADYVAEALADDDKKVVVFAHHLDVIALLMERLAEFKPMRVTGSDSTEDRQRSVDAFQNDAGVRVLVGSILAAGVGYTLTAASYVVFAELDWVPKNISQAEDRCHRIGQHDNVLVDHLVIDGSLDVKFAKTIVRKQRIADKALDK